MVTPERTMLQDEREIKRAELWAELRAEQGVQSARNHEAGGSKYELSEDDRPPVPPGVIFYMDNRV